jgi:hypothetical protein
MHFSRKLASILPWNVDDEEVNDDKRPPSDKANVPYMEFG